MTNADKFKEVFGFGVCSMTECKECPHFYYTDYDEDGHCKEMDFWREEYKPTVEPQEWISVKDRLPTKEKSIKNGEMFIVSDGERTYAEYLDRNGRGFGEPTSFGFRIDRAVVAWRELPSPYKGE